MTSPLHAPSQVAVGTRASVARAAVAAGVRPGWAAARAAPVFGPWNVIPASGLSDEPAADGATAGEVTAGGVAAGAGTGAGVAAGARRVSSASSAAPWATCAAAGPAAGWAAEDVPAGVSQGATRPAVIVAAASPPVHSRRRRPARCPRGVPAGSRRDVSMRAP